MRRRTAINMRRNGYRSNLLVGFVPKTSHGSELWMLGSRKFATSRHWIRIARLELIRLRRFGDTFAGRNRLLQLIPTEHHETCPVVGIALRRGTRSPCYRARSHRRKTSSTTAVQLL